MKYDVMIENRGARDILITGVDEESLGETIVVTRSEDENDGQ